MLENAGLKVLEGRPLSKMTSFRVGGPADVFVQVRSVDEIRMVCATARAAGAEWFVIGAGSNLLAPDDGFRGVVMRLVKDLAAVSFREHRMISGAGTKLATLCSAAAHEGLSGLEFASGIPGTVGGALYMNAGAWGSCILERTVGVTVFDVEHNEVRSEHGPFPAGYRKSPWQKKGLVILSAEFELVPADHAEIMEKMKELSAKRKKHQPLSKPSAGSVFRNPPAGGKAKDLIAAAGLKGLRQGGAMVSRKHANFIVNESGASSADIRTLVRTVRDEVEKKTGIRLQPEVEVMQGEPL
jgi:UDP-N-acetylmuramate dehydrogenase